MKFFKRIIRKILASEGNRQDLGDTDTGNPCAYTACGYNDTDSTDSKGQKFSSQTEPENRVFTTVGENLSHLKNKIGVSDDLVENRYDLSGSNIKVGVAYISIMADKELISQYVLLPLLKMDKDLGKSTSETLTSLQAVIPATDTYVTDNMLQIIYALLEGRTALFIDNSQMALVIGSQKITKRPIEKPENESTVFGSQESFTDNIDTNMSLIIKRLPIRELHFETYSIGRLSRTAVKLVWLDGIINEKIIDDIKSRMQNIDVDIIGGVGELVELIEDKPSSLFPKYKQTERPDVSAKFLTDGCFAIICNNCPFAITAPFTLWDNLKTMDDYEDRPARSSYLRIVRYIAFFISVFISPLYLAFVTYNQSVVPPTLAITIASGREGVPFPTVIEIIFLSFIMSIVREAGLRMPGSVGYFIGTLAAVLIGQAIVMAGYVDASLIIVVAISTISSFAISTTTLTFTSSLLNYIFIVITGFLGIFGLICGITVLSWYLLTLRSFGLPYLYPVFPFDSEQCKDTIIRARIGNIKERSKIMSPYDLNKNRGKEGKKGDE